MPDSRIALKARLNSLSRDKLRTRAVELGAEIPEGASPATMREIVLQAELTALTKAAKEE